ncbi:unnamed protein product, partial [Mesorhabditis belari]|uniref:Solute carrier family 35 member B1 n=1 Tax=Mesorhabditis belari TaxID=2138241 RepID=A0AAF3EAV2_9BILA
MTRPEAEDVTAKHKAKIDPHDQRSFVNNALHLIICAAGILGFFFAFGVYQEKIVQGKYDGNDKFTYTQALVFFVCAASSIFAYFFMGDGGHDNVPKRYYVSCAASYLLAMLSSNQALQYLPYPTQVLAKSFLFIVFGVALFMYKDKKTAQAEGGIGWGEILLILSLAFDGTTTSIQDQIKTHYKRTALSMMFYMNFFASIFLIIGLVATGELFEFIAFVQRYPEILWSLSIFAISSCAGQYFIFKTVHEFSPLTCSIITTTRKLFTIIISVIFFSHPISERQMVATFIVFACLFLDAMGSKKRPK